jgi:hypothetical protein
MFLVARAMRVVGVSGLVITLAGLTAACSSSPSGPSSGGSGGTAAALQSVAVNPASMQGAGAVTGTVTVSPAATSALSVALQSSSASATVPASVTIAAGASSATFPVNAASVTANTTATITASYSGVTRTATLTLTPPAANAALQSVSLNPSSAQGSGVATGTVTVTAGGTSAVVTLQSSNPGAASVPASVTVAAGATTATFSVSYSAVSASTTVTITASLSGVSRTATLALSPQTQASVPTKVWRGFAGPASATNCTGGFADIVLYENNVPATGTFVQCDTAGRPLAYIAATVTGVQTNSFGAFTLTVTVQLSTGTYSLSPYLEYFASGVLFANTGPGNTSLGAILAPGLQRTVTVTLPTVNAGNRITASSNNFLSYLCQQQGSSCAPF